MSWNLYFKGSMWKTVLHSQTFLLKLAKRKPGYLGVLERYEILDT